jgi:hypothetical protein
MVSTLSPLCRKTHRCRRFTHLLTLVAVAAPALACVTEPDVPPAHLKHGLEVRILNGWLEDRDHARIGGACLVLYDGKRVVSSQNANGKGDFHFDKLPAGNYDLVISDNHGLFRPLDVPVKIVSSAKAPAQNVRVWLETLSRRNFNSDPYRLTPP